MMLGTITFHSGTVVLNGLYSVAGPTVLNGASTQVTLNQFAFQRCWGYLLSMPEPWYLSITILVRLAAEQILVEREQWSSNLER